MTFVLTGRKTFAMFATGFGIIIAVNVTLAVNAVKTFPGLETANSYVASQAFDSDRAAQQALGWRAVAHLSDDAVTLDLRDATGAPVTDVTFDATLGRATNVAQDVTPAFVFDGTVWTAPVSIPPGNWDLRLVATRADGTTFRKRLKLRTGQ
ncbi:FixH family protein [Jannaschia donghaensis]|uniref:Putative integral membrane protein linked to a cation pump n=1 Tax=Jannaschia donghaensis TaxID=420998 RepID=A0A0M6YGL8_9RHOB|nr:FixH family protein [Jannaschia donghaensis]CTQ49498.1 putative integral membrane protein linked to a cation pump [Jannaschia donghaensis]